MGMDEALVVRKRALMAPRDSLIGAAVRRWLASG